MLSVMSILDKLYQVKSPSGYEREMAKVISELAEKAELSCSADSLGNLIVHKKGDGKRCILEAHMDTTGLMATYIDENGFVRFDALGKVSAEDICGASVEFLNGISGTVACEGKCEEAKRKISSMFIDIGAKSADSAKSCILPGDAAVFCGKVKKLADGRIAAPYLDNRIGCAIALWTMMNLKKSDYDVYAVFSVQKEVGNRGAKTAAYALDADFAIVIDATPAPDTPNPANFGETKLSEGPAIKIMDAAFVAHHEIVLALSETAEKNKIVYQREVVPAERTNGGINTISSGLPTGGISVPVRYMHTPCEVADTEDITFTAKLLLNTLENNAVFFTKA